MKPINASQLHEMMLKQPGLPVIDVLPAQTHSEAHIPGTANVPLEEPQFIEKVQRLAADREQPVVVYCARRECDASPRAAAKLEEAGYRNVYDFEGGMAEWESAGYSLVAT